MRAPPDRTNEGRALRRPRPLSPAATVTRAPSRLALRLLVATMPLFPSLAHADTTLPGSDGKGGAAHVKLMPKPIGGLRVAPRLPGAMPAPHLPPPPPKEVDPPAPKAVDPAPPKAVDPPAAPKQAEHK